MNPSRLAPLLVAGLALAAGTSSCPAADWEVLYLDGASAHFDGLGWDDAAETDADPDSFVAGWTSAFGASGGTWDDDLSIVAEMPGAFRRALGRVPFDRVGSVDLGGVEVHLYRDRVKAQRGDRNASAIHALAVDTEDLDVDVAAWMETIAWARGRVVEDGWAVGARRLAIALAARVRTEIAENVTQALVIDFTADYGYDFHAELTRGGDDFLYQMLCEVRLAGLDLSVGFFDGARDQFETLDARVEAAMSEAYETHGAGAAALAAYRERKAEEERRYQEELEAKALRELREAAERAEREGRQAGDDEPIGGGYFGMGG